ncbi:SDR family NAD(P)-dependent oxidoreductase [Sphingobium lactosutens]|uniref:Short-chain dehydrogenase n=1 Tax=Sphingobium lactosutens DS20 TaxID=1331060 RepID=T0H419_9SPHN|nr:SDR family oxidoreductase [Sphingobium lactosutens]EQB11126.1 hypothetical protein RLDS_24850 [Sphingobium lactosutens DS20]
MSDELSGKVVLVTGAARGIGQASAIRIARAGANVVVSDILEEEGKQVVEMIKEAGGTATFVRADLSHEEEISGLINKITSDLHRLDGAFNNAGVLQHGKSLHELATEEWEKVINIDLTGVFLCMKYEIMAMLDRGVGGAIVNTASALGQVAITGASEYIAAKHGVLGITRAAAAEYGAKGIRVNAILPGIVETHDEGLLDNYLRQVLSSLKSRHPIGRFGRPDEVGDAAVWLLSNGSSFVNGAAIPVDGGYLAT